MPPSGMSFCPGSRCSKFLNSSVTIWLLVIVTPRW